MLAPIRTEALRRLQYLQEMLLELRVLESQLQSKPNVLPQLKGLVFVQMYATYEYSVVNATLSALRHIDSAGIPLGVLRTTLLSALLHPELMSLSDLSIEKSWDRRMELFEKSRATSARPPIDPAFPNDGSHFRPEQLTTIWRILGIPLPVVHEPRMLGRIRELVEHRNAIAHGREPPESIGRRFSVTDLIDRHTDLEKFCTYFFQTLDSHCVNPTNYS